MPFRYDALVATLTTLPRVEAGQMFGKACLKSGGKAFVALHRDDMVFKLTGAEHAEALAQPGARLWDPSGKGRSMREWVALPEASDELAGRLALAALAYVS
ncbi:MAG: hypothetical protein CGW95_05750 [Phenylobacterium zucineum]|nr:MAG: hypothetical protein CGW95_05750 [Phenylobacterium zucineum]